MALAPSRRSPIMCLTQDGLACTHAEQADALLRAGAQWIQVRRKDPVPTGEGAGAAAWLASLRQIVARCHASNAICIINDRADLAVAAGADGAHLGRADGDWREARRILGPDRILGGTVNHLDDAQAARAADCLDYVGVGPLRFTRTKARLAPVLGLAGLEPLLRTLGRLPAWVIGGVEAADLPALRAAGAAGAAVSSALYRDGRIADNFATLQAAWAGGVLSPTLP